MNESWDIKTMNEKKKKSDLKGMMVFYIDVGQLPPYKAEAFVERWKETAKKQIKKLKKNGVESMWIPVRPGSQTRVEFLQTAAATDFFTEETTIKADEQSVELTE